MQLDEVAMYSTTNGKLAQRIAQLCGKLCGKAGGMGFDATITEASAGVGGNTLFFAEATLSLSLVA